jgi:hypothetical protein
MVHKVALFEGLNSSVYNNSFVKQELIGIHG